MAAGWSATERLSASERRHASRRWALPTGWQHRVYSAMAKVMVSLPDDLLRAVDVEAGRRGTTRSGLLRELAEETLHQRRIRRAERIAEIDALGGSPVGHGGSVAELVKASRPQH